MNASGWFPWLLPWRFTACHSYMKQENKERPLFSCNGVGFDLSSRAVASQVFSALQSLTSVFGMGTGGPSALEVLTQSKFCFDCFGAPSGIQPRDASRTHMTKMAVALFSHWYAFWCTFRDSNPGPTD